MATNNSCNYSPIQHDVLVGGANGSITSVSPSTAGFVLTSNGTGSDPSFQAAAISSVTGTANQISVATTSGNAVVSITNGAYIGTSATPPLGGLLVSGISGFGTTSPGLNAQVNINSTRAYGLSVGGTSVTLDGSTNQHGVVVNSILSAGNGTISSGIYVNPNFRVPVGTGPFLAAGMYVFPSLSGNSQTIATYSGMVIPAVSVTNVTNAYGLVVAPAQSATNTNKATWTYDLTVGASVGTTACPTSGALIEGSIVNQALSNFSVVATDGTNTLTSIPNSTAGFVLTSNGASAQPTFQDPSNFPVKYTNVTSAASPYTVLATDYYLSVDCSAGPVVLNFPNSPIANRTWVVKDRTGNSATNNITLTTPGGTVTFDGTTSKVMNSNYQALQLLANSSPNYEVF